METEIYGGLDIYVSRVHKTRHMQYVCFNIAIFSPSSSVVAQDIILFTDIHHKYVQTATVPYVFCINTMRNPATCTSLEFMLPYW